MVALKRGNRVQNVKYSLRYDKYVNCILMIISMSFLFTKCYASCYSGNICSFIKHILSLYRLSLPVNPWFLLTACYVYLYVIKIIINYKQSWNVFGKILAWVSNYWEKFKNRQNILRKAFLDLFTFSLHLKWNRNRLFSTESKWTSCLLSCPTLWETNWCLVYINNSIAYRVVYPFLVRTDKFASMQWTIF